MTLARQGPETGCPINAFKYYIIQLAIINRLPVKSLLHIRSVSKVVELFRTEHVGYVVFGVPFVRSEKPSRCCDECIPIMVKKVVGGCGVEGCSDFKQWGMALRATNYVIAFGLALVTGMFGRHRIHFLKRVQYLGTIHYKVLDVGSYGKDITVGAAMILANVSVFTPKPSEHYLNITKRNVVEVFRKDTISLV
ncbi:transposase, MuDR, MULE transposase domain protein [Tanacetum coccineum]